MPLAATVLASFVYRFFTFWLRIVPAFEGRLTQGRLRVSGTGGAGRPKAVGPAILILGAVALGVVLIVFAPGAAPSAASRCRRA